MSDCFGGRSAPESSCPKTSDVTKNLTKNLTKDVQPVELKAATHQVGDPAQSNVLAVSLVPETKATSALVRCFSFRKGPSAMLPRVWTGALVALVAIALAQSELLWALGFVLLLLDFVYLWFSHARIAEVLRKVEPLCCRHPVKQLLLAVISANPGLTMGTALAVCAWCLQFVFSLAVYAGHPLPNSGLIQAVILWVAGVGGVQLFLFAVVALCLWCQIKAYGPMGAFIEARSTTGERVAAVRYGAIAGGALGLTYFWMALSSPGANADFLPWWRLAIALMAGATLICFLTLWRVNAKLRTVLKSQSL